MREGDATGLEDGDQVVQVAPPEGLAGAKQRPPLLLFVALGVTLGIAMAFVLDDRAAEPGTESVAEPRPPVAHEVDVAGPAPADLPVDFVSAAHAQTSAPATPVPKQAPDVKQGPDPELRRALGAAKSTPPDGGAMAAVEPDHHGLEPSLARALYELGQGQQAAGELDAAIESYRRSGALDPRQAQTFYDWGWLLQQKGDVPGAIDKYRMAVELEPAHTFANYNMGWLMQEAGDVTGAQIVYENAVAAGAANALTFYNLGWLMQKAGDETAAMQNYEAALAEDPNHAFANLNLGALHEKRGATGLAARHYRKALESRPDLPQAEERLAALEQGASGRE